VTAARRGGRRPLFSAHPERVSWGYERRRPAKDFACGDGSERAMHPCAPFGAERYEAALRDDDEPSVTAKR